MPVLHSTGDVWNGSMSGVIEVEHSAQLEEAANFCLMIRRLINLEVFSSDPVYHEMVLY